MYYADMQMTMPRGGKRPGAGRPPKFGQALLSTPTLINSTRDMKAAWKRAAAAADRELPDWIRDTLNKAAGF